LPKDFSLTAELSWLPKNEDWDQSVQLAVGAPDNASLWARLVACANANIDFAQTTKLDNLTRRLGKAGSLIPPGKPVRLALLGSSTIRHLVPGIRVAGLRRGLWIEVYEPAYGQYLQELMDTTSALHAWRPEFVAFALDAQHLAHVSGVRPDAAIEHVRNCWHVAKESLHCTVIQQTALPVFADLMGSNEHRMQDSPQGFVRRFNTLLEAAADEVGVHLLAIDKYAAVDGLGTWHDVALWHRSKQEVHPAVSHLYSDYLVRVVAAQRGRSYKCLVLDLDNTLWGGVIGDDGLQGIVLGQGGAVGEAHVAFQRYALRLKERGILLAVCSKNDEANARMPFAEHPEMVLKLEDIACFVTNWEDKATNLRLIAQALNIGIDSLVFADDNPFERNLVRRELPEVAVPELPEDPAYFVDCIAGAGYFESLALSVEDRERARLYQANAEREQLRGSATNIQDYLKSLNMEMTWKPFDDLGMQRIVQLMNKTNQFNLTTTRYGEAEVRSMMNDRNVLTWQVRFKDRFGDNGIIALLIGKVNGAKDLEIDTWLMSCRVLGRQVEEACLHLIVEGARRLSAERIRGRYRATPRNGMVRDLYRRLGFTQVGLVDSNTAAESAEWLLDVSGFTPQPCEITISEESKAMVD
jgi:FkbH-like protein